jgi:hypothetical protein
VAAPSRSLSPPVFCSRTPAPEGVEPCSPCPKRCTHMFTRMHALTSELPCRRGHPSHNAVELEPHRAVFHRSVVLVRELHLTAACTRMRSTKLLPLLSLHESSEHDHACEPNLTVAQTVTAGTPPSRASFPPRRASASQPEHAFTLGYTSAYNLTGAGHPSLVAGVPCLAFPRRAITHRR